MTVEKPGSSMRVAGFSLLVLVAACSAMPETAVENTMVTDLNATEGLEDVTTAESAPAGWSFSEHTDPITDERFYRSVIEAVGDAHKLAVTTTCRFSDGIPSLTIDGYTSAGEPAPYAFGTAIQFRGDRSAPYSLVANNTRFNNSRVLEPNLDDSQSWMPFLGETLAIRVPFQTGDETFVLSFDDDNFRAAMSPCVARWKALRGQERAREQAETQAEEARGAWDAQPPIEAGGPSAPVNEAFLPDPRS